MAQQYRTHCSLHKRENTHFYSVKCEYLEVDAKLPNITINIGQDQNLTLTPEVYEGICWPNGLLQDCQTNIEVTTDKRMPTILLGQAFLKFYYTTFNLEDDTITLGRSKQDINIDGSQGRITKRKLIHIMSRFILIIFLTLLITLMIRKEFFMKMLYEDCPRLKDCDRLLTIALYFVVGVSSYYLFY